MNAAAILAVIFVFIVVKSVIDGRARTELRRMELIEKAIDSGHIDARMKEELVRGLGRSRLGILAHVSALGWVGMFVGLGLMSGSFLTHELYEYRVPGLIVALVCFGVLTYPFALRELEARGRA